MHTRERTWHALGELVEHGELYRFRQAGLSLAASDDGWTRIRLSLDPDASPARSWALEPDAEATRTWVPQALCDPPAERAVREVRRPTLPGSSVEGESNPHVDTRGLLTERIGSTGLAVSLQAAGEPAPSNGEPAPGAVEAPATIALRIGRCRDGFLLELPVPHSCRVYGLGEKTGGLDKRGQTWSFWNSDEPLHLAHRDPLYQSIPLAYVFTPEETLTLFCDSPATQYFDVCESDPGTLRVEVYDTRATFYLRRDRTLPQAVRAWAGLTGYMPLPPEWALGFQQCRYSYMPEARVLELAARMRSERIPCDVVYLDIHYMDGYRVFTWNPERFPDPAAMIESLHRDGFRVVTIVDPGVKIDPDYSVYADGLARGLYLEHPNGLPYEGRVWPGPAVFPDFTSEATRQWWGECHQRLLAAGVDGIWNDMNEPADFDGDPDFRPNFTVPDGLVAEDDGDRRSFGLVHNAYANGMARATRAGLRAGNADRRGFVLTRAGYAGIQRDAAVWTGDNHSWWEHLAVTIPMQLNLGLSGVAFTGADAGGFQLNASPELFARWVGAAALMPFFRAHTAIDTLDHEPWSFGPQVLDAVRELIGLRYRLLPYLYTLFEHAARTGEPIIRPLVWAYPADPRVHDRADSFMLGDDLLVAPVRERGVEERSVYLPEGVWYDYWSGEAWRGGRAVVVEAPLDRVPLFVRAGAIVAHESVRQYTGAAGDGVLRLLVAPGVDSDTGAPSGGGATADAADPGARARGTLYADAGDGYEYRSGAFWRAEFSFADGVLRVATREGSSGHARWHSVAATVLGAGTRSESEPVAIEPGGAEIHV